MKNCTCCKQTKPLEDFYIKNGEDRHHSFCKSCLNIYHMKRWTQRKLDAIEYKGGKCSDCGFKGYHGVFEFHHRDPEQKEMDWNKMRLTSITKMRLELDKCDILCANCHRIRHKAE